MLLKRLRIEAGLTQQEVARQLSRHHPFVHDYETGQRRLDVIRLREVADVLGTTLVAISEELFGTHNSANRTKPTSRTSRCVIRPYKTEWTRLCKYLRSVRQAAGLTEVDVAARLDEPQSFVSKYETMRRRLDLIELEQVAAALDTTLLSLVTEFERGSKPAE